MYERTWTADIDEQSLRELLESRFNCWQGEWFTKIEPFQWVRSLLKYVPSERSSNGEYTIEPIPAKSSGSPAVVTKVRFRSIAQLRTIKGAPIEYTEFGTFAKIVEEEFSERLISAAKSKKPPTQTTTRKRPIEGDDDVSTDAGNKRRGRPRDSLNKSAVSPARKGGNTSKNNDSAPIRRPMPSFITPRSLSFVTYMSGNFEDAEGKHLPLGDMVRGKQMPQDYQYRVDSTFRLRATVPGSHDKPIELN